MESSMSSDFGGERGLDNKEVMSSSSTTSNNSSSVEVLGVFGPNDESEMSENDISLSMKDKPVSSIEETGEEEENDTANTSQSVEGSVNDVDVNGLPDQIVSNGLQCDESMSATGRAATSTAEATQRETDSATTQKNETSSIDNDNKSNQESESDKLGSVTDHNKKISIIVKIPIETPSETKPHGMQTRKRKVSDSITANIIESDVENLCLLDKNSYNETEGKDAFRFYKEEMFPFSFPWYGGQELQANVPRDIDDLHGIFFADDENDAECFPLFGLIDDKSNPALNSFEFSKKTQSVDKKGLLWLGHNDDDGAKEHSIASVRRSDDSGIIELIVSLPSVPLEFASKEDDVEEGPTLSSKTKLLLSRRAEVMSHFPWNGKPRLDGNKNDKQKFNEVFKNVQNTRCNHFYANTDKVKECLIRAEERKKYIFNLKRNTQKWNISVKVGGVSSRSKLFPFINSSNVDNENILSDDDEPRSINRKRRQDIFASSEIETCAATLPAYVQTGRCVSLETAIAISSNEKLKSSLAKETVNSESASQSSSKKKKSNNNANRNQRVLVGRTRLIWTKKLVNNTEDGYCVFDKNIASGKFKNNPIFSALDSRNDDKNMMQRANNNKVYYTSLLTGHRLDSNSSRRRREVTVGIKVDNCLMLAKDLNDNASPGKEKTIQDSNTKEPCIEDGDFIMQSPHPHNAVCVLNRNSFYEALTKEAKNPKKSYTFQHHIPIPSDNDDLFMINNSTDYNKNRFVMKITAPRLGCISLDDGPLRGVCYSSGIVKGASPLAVHLMLNQAAKIHLDRRLCTVCWMDDNEMMVRECCDCKLLAHISCCKNQGHLFDDKWRCAVCQDYHILSMSSMEKRISKPLRRTRLPSRFSSDADVLLTDVTIGKDDVSISEEMQHWEKRVAKQCILCPYSGGAMSPVSNSYDDKRWMHEICGIWCSHAGKKKEKDAMNDKVNKVCVICGNGDGKDSMKKDKKSGASEDSSKVTNQNNASRIERTSRLVKCAMDGCSIHFHPFCAIITSKCRQGEQLQSSHSLLSENNRSSLRSLRNSSDSLKDEEIAKLLKEMASNDKELTRQFTLQLLNISRNEGSYGSCFEGTEKTSTVPVAFCGLHNPKRERSLFGCPPMACNALSSAMHIPNFPE